MQAKVTALGRLTQSASVAQVSHVLSPASLPFKQLLGGTEMYFSVSRTVPSSNGSAGVGGGVPPPEPEGDNGTRISVALRASKETMELAL